jgi:hypothetical protein
MKANTSREQVVQKARRAFTKAQWGRWRSPETLWHLLWKRFSQRKWKSVGRKGDQSQIPKKCNKRFSRPKVWKPTGRKGPKSHTFPGKCNRIKCDNRVISKLNPVFTLLLGLLSPPMPSFRNLKTFY